MTTLETFKNGLPSVIGDNLGKIALGAGVGVVGAGLVGLAIAGAKNKRKSSKRGSKRDRMFKSKQKHEQRHKRKRKYKIYGRKGWIHPKRKRKSNRSSRRGVKYTKNGQPYIILASGKARFIKGKRRSKK